MSLFYYSISLFLFCFSCSFIKTNTLTHLHINAFFYVISRCKDTNLFLFGKIIFSGQSSVQFSQR